MGVEKPKTSLLSYIGLAISLANLWLLREWFHSVIPSPLSYSLYAVDLTRVLAITLVFFGLIVIFFMVVYGSERLAVPWVSTLSYYCLALCFFLALNHVRICAGLSTQFPFLSCKHFLGNWGSGNCFKLPILLLGF